MRGELLGFLRESTGVLTLEDILLNFIVAALLSVFIYISYRLSHAGAVYSAYFNVSLIMLTLTTTLVMNVIGNNIALSLGMVGALSIVRFRHGYQGPAGYDIYLLVHCHRHLLRRLGIHDRRNRFGSYLFVYAVIRGNQKQRPLPADHPRQTRA